MRPRTLLLATVAAIVPVAAIADDLVVAVAPIDYAGVCDAFGSGYMYIPGTQTCLGVGGYLQVDVWRYGSDQARNYFNLATYLTGSTPVPTDPLAEVSGPVAGYLYRTDGYASHWDISEELKVAFHTKSHTDFGVLETYARFVVEAGPSSSNSNTAAALVEDVGLDKGYAALGPLFVGSYDTIFAYQAAGFSLDGATNADPVVDQVQLRHNAGPWLVQFALEDPRDWFSTASNATGDYPNLAFALSGTWKHAYLQAALGVTDRTSGTGWGAQLSGSLGSGTQPQLQVNLAYAENAPAYVGGVNCTAACPNEGRWWSTMASGQVNLTRTLSLNATASYLDGPSTRSWQAAAGAGWAPTSTALVSAELLYADDDGADSFGLHTQLKTSFGND